jgi:cytochrome P450
MVSGATVKWNPFSKGYYNDPYPHLTACRASNPIQKSDLLEDAWFFFEYKDVSSLLRNSDLQASDLRAFFLQKEHIIFNEPGACPYLAKGTSKWPMYLNGLEHKAVRSLIGKSFKDIEVNTIIQKAFHEHFHKFRSNHSFDLVEFCSVFIFLIVKDFFGIDDYESLDHVKKYSNLLARSQDLYISKPVYREINEGFHWGKKLFAKSAFRERFITNAQEAGVVFTEDEVYSVMSVLLMASFETSKDNLSISLMEILKNPELIQFVLNADQQAINVFIEELIRFSTPLHYTIRRNSEPLIYKGHNIPAQSKLFLSLASANRDPLVFSDPDKIIPNRTPNEHLSFGFGSHFCLGAQIARQELRYCLKPMVEFLKDFKINDAIEPKWARQIFMRTLESIHVTKAAQ